MNFLYNIKVILNNYLLEGCVDGNNGIRHCELVVLDGNRLSALSGISQGLEFITSGRSNSEIHFVAIVGGSGSLNGTILDVRHGDGVVSQFEGNGNSHIACRHSEAVSITRLSNFYLRTILCSDGNLINSITNAWFGIYFNEVTHIASIHTDVKTTILCRSFGNVEQLL